jgi:hypothetical protein
MPVLSNAQIIALWLNQGGQLSSATQAVARALSESSGSTTVTSANPDGGTNVGLYQLDTKGVGAGKTVAQLQDPYTNTKLTVDYTNNGQNWGAWDDNYLAFLDQAQQSVNEYAASAQGSASTSYMEQQLQGVAGKGATPIISGPGPAVTPGAPSSMPSSTSNGATGSQTQSLIGQAGSTVSDAGALLHGAAESLNFFWEFFQPGQAWRLAFGAGAVVLGYAGLRTWGLVPAVKLGGV